MYLPHDEKDWEPLNNRKAADAIRGLNGHLQNVHGVNDFLYSGSALQRLKQWLLRSTGKYSPGQLSIAGLRIQVEQVDYRPLTFYGNKWYLYRFACAIDHIEKLVGYERIAHIFAVCGPSEPNSQKQQNPLIEPDNWTLLDWKSPPIHQLNKKRDLDFSKLSASQLRDYLGDYLVFFCSFLGGEEGDDIVPFLIPGNAQDFRWDDALPLQKRNLITFSPPPQDINIADDFDLPQPDTTASKTKATDGIASDTVSMATPQKLVEDEFGEKENPPYPELKTEIPHTEPQGSVTSSQEANNIAGCFKDVLVCYKNGLFRTIFSVTANGLVSMDDDKPVAGATDLSLLRWVVRYGPYPVPLLCREEKREEISVEHLLERIKRHIGPRSNTEPPIRLRGLRVGRTVDDKVQLTGTFPETVRLDNVVFPGDVILDDAIFEHSLDLIDCRLLGRLSAENATIKGAFHLNGSSLYDTDTDQEKSSPNTGSSLDPKHDPVINLDGLKVKRGLFADRVTAFGRIRTRGAQITGPMSARGLQIHARSANVDNDNPILDFSHMRIDGPLDLSGDIPNKNRLDKVRRTVIEGTAVMQSLQALQVDLNGIRIDGNLNLGACRITNTLTMMVTKLPADLPADSECFWRTHIKGFFNVNQARVGFMNISGSWIEGSLSLEDLQLDGSLFARLESRFRTRIGGDLMVFGAAIRGDIDLTGVEIGGELFFITGNCDRLMMRAGAWLEPPGQQSSDPIPRISLATANGVFLQDVTISAGMDLTGIHLGTNKEAAHQANGYDGKNHFTGSFTSLGTRCLGGGVRFWREDAPTRFSEIFKDLESSLAPKVKDKERERENARKRAIDQIRTRIHGNLDLRGIQTADSIDLGRCGVDGSIQLENARIGGSLRACIENETRVNETVACSTENFQADIARIEGNVDLSGLIVRHNLHARDLQVSGNLLLASYDPCPADPHAQVGGMIDLEGTQVAARLVLSSQNLTTLANNAPDKARINLARCRVGQLAIRGFGKQENSREKYTFPHTISLLATEVRDWHFGNSEKHKQVLALLEKTEPFDAGNYIDVEHRLARIGDKQLADKVYCKMKKRRSESLKEWEWIKNFIDREFSRHGTFPELMAFWLIISMIPIIFILSNPRNVEFALTSDSKSSSNHQPYDLEKDWGLLKAAGLAADYAIPFFGDARFLNDPKNVELALTSDSKSSAVPLSNHQPYDLEKDWGLLKAAGLATSYAIPFFGSAHSEMVRARLNGGICLLPLPRSPNHPEIPSQSAPETVPPPASEKKVEESAECNDISIISPHEMAMTMSIFQFFLWILIAANLPTIIRRRS